MRKPTYRILQNENGYYLILTDEHGDVVLRSKEYKNYRLCKTDLLNLKVHMCFQSNFFRTKITAETFSFEIRTCWDDLMAFGPEFNTRFERNELMHAIQEMSKQAVFVDAQIETPSLVPISIAS